MIRAQIRPAAWAAHTGKAAGEAPSGPALGEEEFRALYQRTARPLRAYLRRLLGDADLADDLLQESYLRLLRQPRERVVALGEEHRPAYLYRIASRLAQDHWRSARHRREHARAQQATEAAAAVATEPPGDVARAFAELAGRDRALLWLAHVEERDHREIARILGLAAPSVRVLLFRARRRLGRLLAARGLSPADFAAPRAGGSPARRRGGTSGEQK